MHDRRLDSCRLLDSNMKKKTRAIWIVQRSHVLQKYSETFSQRKRADLSLFSGNQTCDVNSDEICAGLQNTTWKHIKWPLYSLKSTKKSVKYCQAKSVNVHIARYSCMFISSKSCFRPWPFQYFPPNCRWRKLSQSKMLPMINVQDSREFLSQNKVQSNRQTWEQCSLKEFKARCKISGESELLNNKKWSEMSFGSV